MGEANICGTITEGVGSKMRFDGSQTLVITDNAQAQRIRGIDGVASTLQGLAGGQGAKTGLYDVTPIAMRTRDNGYKEIEPKQDGIANSITGVQTDSMVIIHENKSGKRTPHEEAQALRSGASHNYQTVANAVDTDGYLRSGARPRGENGKPQLLPIGYRRIRRLTPIECERLQGFPDNWTKYGLTKDGKVIEISDTQRYKCCGNAVTTNVITAIGTQLLKAISEG
jgi:DNA (cytosine-5)-methyltransferase 1